MSYLARRAPIFPAPLRVLSGEPGRGEAAARLTVTEDGALEGHIRLEGAISGPVDMDSPVYVQVGDALYEASPVETAEEGEAPFTLYVPSDPMSDEIRVLYLLDGQLLWAGQVDSNYK